MTSISSQNPPRRTFTKQRRRLTAAERRRYANQAVRHLNHRVLSRHCNHIGIYLDDFGELPTLPLFLWAKKRGKSVYLPVVMGNTLKFRKVDYKHLRIARFAMHHLGMKEPKTGVLQAVTCLDVLFLPLVAADKQGNRMGMGGGFYDRTLAQVSRHSMNKKVIKKPFRIGWCYDFQVTEKLEATPWDVPLHAIVTPCHYKSFTGATYY